MFPTSQPQKKRLLSGMQPTSDTLHLGNYFGALKHWVALQDTYDCYFFIADLHALTVAIRPEQLQKNVRETLLTYLAAGLDPSKCTIFLQSHIHEHAELAWIFSTIVPVGELERMTQYKDKAKMQRQNVNAGLLTYPALMAADILLYKPYGVPVGDDQTQHVEMTRMIARLFNHRYGPTFPEPKLVLTKTPRIMSLADPTKKMSKSLGEKYYIALTDDPKIIRKKIASSITDTGSLSKKTKSPGVQNLFQLLEACSPKEVQQFEDLYKNDHLQYKHLKAAVADSIIGVLEPLQKKRQSLRANFTSEILIKGNEKAKNMAKQTLEEVRKKVGLR